MRSSEYKIILYPSSSSSFHNLLLCFITILVLMYHHLFLFFVSIYYSPFIIVLVYTSIVCMWNKPHVCMIVIFIIIWKTTMMINACLPYVSHIS